MLRILTVDDSRVIRTLMVDHLGSQGFEVVQAENGKAAILLLEADQKGFDLILMDWEMPELTGPETVAKLRSMGYKTPIIMVTSKSEVSDISKMLEIGADDYIVKPFTKDLVLTKVREALASKKAA